MRKSKERKFSRPADVRVPCPAGHEFTLRVDPRDYAFLGPDARHRGIVCPECGARLALGVRALVAATHLPEVVTENPLIPVEAVEADAPKVEVPPPDPAFCEQVQPRAEESQPWKRIVGPGEAEARRAAGPGFGGR